MVAVSAAVDAAWRSSHEATFSVTLTSSSGELIRTLYPSTGSVTVDGRRSIRSSVSLTLPDYDGTLIPTNAISYPLGPFAGNRIVVRRGLTGGSVSDMVTVGVFNPTSVSIDSGDAGTTVTVEGEDLAGALSKRWAQTYNLAGGVNLATAITSILTSVNPALTFNLTSTSFVTPWITFGTDGNSSPWDDARLLAQAAGQALYMSATGVVTSEPYINPSGDPTFLFNAGTNGVLLGLRRSMAQRAAVNGVVLTAEGSGLLVPIRPENVTGSGGWWVTDTASPLNYVTYGKNPSEMSTPVIVSAAQATTVAAALLNSVVGVQIEVDVVPLPHLSVQDRVRVLDPDSGVDLVGIVDSFTVPLTADASQSVTIRTLSLGGSD